MANPMAWKSALESKLGGEQLLEVVETPFLDKPKSARTGLVGVTQQRMVFYRKKFIGEEFLSFPIEDIAEVAPVEDPLAEMLGKEAVTLGVTMRDGATMQLKWLKADEAERLTSHLVE